MELIACHLPCIIISKPDCKQVEIRQSNQPAAPRSAPSPPTRVSSSRLPEDVMQGVSTFDPAATDPIVDRQPIAQTTSADPQPAPASAVTPTAAPAVASNSVLTPPATEPWVQMVNVWGAAWEACGLTGGPYDVRVTSAVGETVVIR